MTDLFGRKYLLSIGSPAWQGAFVDPVLGAPQANAGIQDVFDTLEGNFTVSEYLPKYVPPTEGQFVEITDLHIKASIPTTKSAGAGTQDMPVFQIYNPSAELVNKLKCYSRIILDAGYEQDETLPTIFEGEIKDIVVARDDQDLVATLICSQGSYVTNKLRVSRSWPPNTLFQIIIRDLTQIISDAGIPCRVNINSPQTAAAIEDFRSTGARYDIEDNTTPDYIPPATFAKHGYSVTGSAIAALAVVANDSGFRTYMVNGTLYVEDKTKPQLREVFELEQDSIKNIEYAKKANAMGAKSASRKEINLSTFLDGRIAVGKKLRITEGEYEGDYDIIKVKHTLDYEGGKWDTDVQAKEVGQ